MTCPHCLSDVRPGEICQGCGWESPRKERDWRFRGNPLIRVRGEVLEKLHDRTDELMNEVYDVGRKVNDTEMKTELEIAYEELGKAAAALNRAKRISEETPRGRR